MYISLHFMKQKAMKLEIHHFQTNYWSNYEWLHYIRKTIINMKKCQERKLWESYVNHASDTHALIELDIIIMCKWTYDLRVNSHENLLLLLPRYESDSVVTECVWLGRINNQTGCPSKTGKSPKRWMVYTNKSHVQYIHHTAALSFICVVMKARGWNSTWP